jgi:hypothetical protein
MQQSGTVLRSLLADLEAAVIDVVVGDVARPADDPVRLREDVARAVRWTIETVNGPDTPPEAALEPLRSLGAEAARTGEGVAPVLDRYLSASWALWEAVAERTDTERADLIPFGARLLRAGDMAAAAIADAFAIAEGELAARSGSVRRALIDDLLAYRPGDPSLARLVRRAASYGLSPGTAVRVVLVATDRDLDDGDPVAARISREFGPRAVLVATDRGRLLALLRPGVVSDVAAERMVAASVGPEPWAGVAATVADGLTGVGAAVAVAHASLDVASRLGLRGRIVAAEDLRLERALLADPVLLAEGVDRVLAPLDAVPRNGGRLVETLRVFVETGGNRRETARLLGLASRTVAYRLDRIEELLGTTLEGPPLIRLAAAIFARGLLRGPAPPSPAG